MKLIIITGAHREVAKDFTFQMARLAPDQQIIIA